MTDEQSTPSLRVVRGEPTAEELAVLTAVISAAAADGPPAPEPLRRGRWNDPARQHRRMPDPGPGAWVSTFR